MLTQRRTAIGSFVFVVFGLVLLALLASGAQTWAAPPSQGSVPPPPHKTPGPTVTPVPLPFTGICCLPGIAFNSNRDGHQQIYIMRIDGSGQTRLTFTQALDLHPGPSADGLHIAFESTRDDPAPLTCGQSGNPNCINHIYIMNVDGSGQTRLTNGNWYDSDPVFSSDSSRIVFDSTRDDPDPLHCGQPGKPNCISQVYEMNPDGSGVTRLTSNPPNVPATNDHPNWSPDDMKIAFYSTRDDPNPQTCGQSGNPACITHIYVMNFDGSNVTRLTNNHGQDEHPAWSPDGTQLAFDSNFEGHFQIYIINADGTNQVRITSDSADDVHPIWKQGCDERIVFASNRDGNGFRIYTMDPNGANQTRLTSETNPNVDDMPAWSGLPLSLRALPGVCCVPGIAFDSLRDGNAEIYLIRSDGTDLTRLTFNPAADQHPGPSYDGKKISFESDRDDPNFQTCGQPGMPNCNFHIYVMNVDGSGVTAITSGDYSDEAPNWSADGSHIAFDSTRDDPNPQTCGQTGKPACIKNIYIMNPDGSGVTRLTSNPPGGTVANTHPQWTIDGSRLAFVSNRDGNDEIYSMNADGSNQTRLTNNPAQDSHPTWSPDNKMIAFESNRDGHFQVYIMNADGTNQTRITSDSADDRAPYYCPTCTNRIVFQSNRDGVNYSIYVMNDDGSNQVRLTIQPPGDTAPDENPAWSGLPVRVPQPIPLPPLGSAGTPTPTPTPSSGGTGGGGTGGGGENLIEAFLNWAGQIFGGQ